jgi:hypothetical protein
VVKDVWAGASPFRIKVESLTLADFTRAEVAALYAQHTEETGQRFTEEALDAAFELTRGQPWLVNALARQCVEVVVTDVHMAIDATCVERAGEILMRRMDTHLDSLAERLREPRVRAVIEPILAGGLLGDVRVDDRRCVVADLGLARPTERGGFEIANPIDREIIARMLSSGPRETLPPTEPKWLAPDGRLVPSALLESFLAFWRQHGQAMLGAAPYHEIAPHLVLLAYLDRVAHGGGRVTREYAIGSGRMDVLLTRGDVRVALELKVWRDGKRDPLVEGLEQLDGYLQGLSLDEGWLVVFDRRSGLPPIEERTAVEEAVTSTGRKVTVIRA